MPSLCCINVTSDVVRIDIMADEDNTLPSAPPSTLPTDASPVLHTPTAAAKATNVNATTDEPLSQSLSTPTPFNASTPTEGTTINATTQVETDNRNRRYL